MSKQLFEEHSKDKDTLTKGLGERKSSWFRTCPGFRHSRHRVRSSLSPPTTLPFPPNHWDRVQTYC